MKEEVNKKEKKKALREKFRTIIAIVLGVFMFGNIIHTHITSDRDRQEYMIDGECHYTIATYEENEYAYLGDWDSFYYIVNGKRYHEDSGGKLHKYSYLPSKDLRFLVRYNVKNPDESDFCEFLVPHWVKAAPVNGWAMFPPDINWAGAVIDSTDMFYWHGYKHRGLGRTEPSPWVMDIPDIVLTQLLPEHKRVSETNFSLRFPENYHAVSRPSHSLSSTFIRNDSMAHIRIATYPDLDYSALLKEVADWRALDTICDNCYYEQSFTLNNHPADFLHYFDPSTERNYMYLFFNDDKQAVVIDADYSPGVWDLKQEIIDILFSVSK